MILPTYEQRRVAWDHYRRFHVVHMEQHRGLRVVEFTDTREVMVTFAQGSAADCRRIYNAFGFHIWGTRDAELYTHFDLTLPDGTPVTQASLTQGRQQFLLVDPHHARAVNVLNVAPAAHAASVPHWITQQYVGAYYASPTSPPLGMGTVTASLPSTRTAEQRQQITEAREVARAWARMHPEIDQAFWHANREVRSYVTGELEIQMRRERLQTPYPYSYGYTAHEARHGLSDEIVLSTPVMALPIWDRLLLARHGAHRPRTTHDVPYLVVKRKV